MAYKFTVTINGVDITNDVERDEYSTGIVPVRTETVTTMDGVDHVSLIRYKNILSIKLNPKALDDVEAICDALLIQPATVTFWSLQRNESVTATMISDSIPSADYLSRCLAGGEKWAQLEPITFTEL